MWLAESLRSKRLIESREGWTRSQLLDHQERSLYDLLRHVWDHSPFYRDYYAQHGIKQGDLCQLGVRDLPVLNKEIVMEGFDRLSLDPLLRRDRLERWLHSDEKNPYQN